MAVAENGSSNNQVESNGVDQSKSSIEIYNLHNNHQSFHQQNHHQHHNSEKKDMKDSESVPMKLNPKAENFVPPLLSKHLLSNHGYNRAQFPLPQPPTAVQFGYPAVIYIQHQINHISFVNIHGISTKRKNGSSSNRKQKMNNQTNIAQQEDAIKRTVHVSDISQQVTEEQLAALFISCGQIVDCRVCGDPKSVLRFAFIEFTDEEGAKNALSIAGTVLGYYPLKVLPSKTAIAPVNPTFLPRSEDEKEMCSRTIYCTNIDKKVTQADVKLFFESYCGEVYRLRLLGEYHQSSRIAFVEFVRAESATAALNFSGSVLGSFPIRVSPSKTPVRKRGARITIK